MKRSVDNSVVMKCNLEDERRSFGGHFMANGGCLELVVQGAAGVARRLSGSVEAASDRERAGGVLPEASCGVAG